MKVKKIRDDHGSVCVTSQIRSFSSFLLIGVSLEQSRRFHPASGETTCMFSSVLRVGLCPKTKCERVRARSCAQKHEVRSQECILTETAHAVAGMRLTAGGVRGVPRGLKHEARVVITPPPRPHTPGHLSL